MGQVVAGGVGAAIGFFVGGPTGAQIGWALGSALYASQQTVKGPALGDAKVQSSNDGLPIAIIYGTSDCYGNVIDTLPITYRYVEVDSGGKGGPTQKEQRAFQTFAIMFCEGPIGGITRIWENEKLVYDVRPGTAMAAESERYAEGIRIHLGGEDQLPDPDLEQYHGVGLTPAHRGTAYVTWISKDITDFGVAIPQIRVEVSNSAAPVPGTWFAGPVVGPGDSTGLRHYVKGPLPTDFGDPTEAPAYITTIGRMSQVDGVLFIHAADASGRGAVSFDRGISWTQVDTALPVTADVNGDGTRYYCGTLTSTDGIAWTTLTAPPFTVKQVVAGPGWALAWVSGTPGSPDRVSTSSDGGTTWSAEVSLGSDRTVGGAYINNNRAHFSIYGSQGWYADLPITSSADLVGPLPDGVYYAAFFDDSTGVLRKGFNGNRLNMSTDNGETHSVYAPFTYGAATTNNIAYGDGIWAALARTSVGTPQGRLMYTSGTAQDGSWTAGTSQTGNGDGSLVYLSESPGGEPGDYTYVDVADIISDQCGRKGLDSSRIDVSQITSTTRGFKVAGNYNPADVIRTLSQIYFFDSPEYDGKVRFIPRGGASVLTIDTDDLIADLEVDESVQSEHAIEYPRVLRIVYGPAETEYQSTTQTSERYSPSVPVLGEVVIEAPLNLTADEAAQRADIAHKVAFVDALGEVRVSVPEDYAELVPSDVMTMNVNGKTARLRLTQIERVDGELRCRARFDRLSAYTSTRTGVAPIGPTPPPSTIAGQTQIVWCNLPAFVSGDNPPNYAYYVGMYGTSSGWNGAELQRSRDSGSSWETLADTSGGTTVSSLVGTVGAFDAASPFMIDEINEITLTLPTGTPFAIVDEYLQSTTTELMQGGANAIVVQGALGADPEIIQFRDCVEVSPTVWTLSGLVRGAQGTTARAHVAGETLLVLRSAFRVPETDESLNTAFSLRAVSYGESVEGATVIDVDWTPPKQVLELAPELVPDRTYGTGDISDIGTSIAALYPPTSGALPDIFPSGRYSGLVWINAVLNGRTIDRLSRSYDISTLLATIEYTSGADTLTRTVTIRTAWNNYGTPSVAMPSYYIQDKLTDAEQTAAFGSVPGSLDVSIYLSNTAIGPGTALEFTI